MFLNNKEFFLLSCDEVLIKSILFGKILHPQIIESNSFIDSTVEPLIF